MFLFSLSLAKAKISTRRIDGINLKGFFKLFKYLHCIKHFVVCSLDASIFMPNSNTGDAAFQEEPCGFSSGSERVVKGHGSSFSFFANITVKSSDR